MVQGYYEFFNDASEPLVNLLPTYANHIEQLGAENYEAYIHQYIQTVPTDYVMYDHYPFRANRESGGMRLHTDYSYNASVVAKLCKEYGKEMRTFVQACEVDNSDEEFTPEMLWFQIHTNLAYGSHAIVYYYYWGSITQQRAGVVDCEGNPTPIYEAAKKIHAELMAYEECLMECTWQKTVYLKGEKAQHNAEEFSHFEGEEQDAPFSLFSSFLHLLNKPFNERHGKSDYRIKSSVKRGNELAALPLNSVRACLVHRLAGGNIRIDFLV
jgi:hypothetical protein